MEKYNDQQEQHLNDIYDRKVLIHGFQTRDPTSISSLPGKVFNGRIVGSAEYNNIDPDYVNKLYSDRQVLLDKVKNGTPLSDADKLQLDEYNKDIAETQNTHVILHLEPKPGATADPTTDDVDLEVSDKTGGQYYAFNNILNNGTGAVKIGNEELYKAPNPPGTKPTGKTITRTGVLNGKKVVQYSDGTVEYAQ
jgi:hypothetical protein